MSLKAKDLPQGGGVEQEALPPAQYPARVVQVIDLGIQAQRDYEGEPKDPINKIRIVYELSDVFMKDADGVEDEEKPRWIAETLAFYPVSNKKANSTKRYKAIAPEGLEDDDFSLLVGMPCQVATSTRVKGDKTYTNVSSVSGPINVKGYVQPELVNPTTVFMLDTPDIEMFKNFPDFLQKEIKENHDYQGSVLQELLGEKPNEQKAPQETQKPAAPAAPKAPEEVA